MSLILVKKVCLHCNEKNANRPRGLCWTCSFSPGVKEQYPPVSAYGRRGYAVPLTRQAKQVVADAFNAVFPDPKPVEKNLFQCWYEFADKSHHVNIVADNPKQAATMFREEASRFGGHLWVVCVQDGMGVVTNHKRRCKLEANELVLQNTGLVFSLLLNPFRITRRSPDYEDYISEGFLVLTKCSKSFDESKGWKFSTYVSNSLFHAWNRLRYQLRLRGVTGFGEDRQTTAPNFLGIMEKSDAILGSGDEVINAASDSELREYLDGILAQLPARNSVAIKERFYHNALLHEVGEVLGVGKERSRQVIEEGLGKMRELMGAAS